MPESKNQSRWIDEICYGPSYLTTLYFIKIIQNTGDGHGRLVYYYYLPYKYFVLSVGLAVPSAVRSRLTETRFGQFNPREHALDKLK